MTNQNFFRSFPRNSPLSSTKSSHSLIYKLFSWRCGTSITETYSHFEIAPSKKINWYSTNICTCLHDFWLFTTTSNYALSTFESDGCLFRWNNLSSNLLIICSIYVFELMNIKGPTRCPNTVQEPVISINSKTQQKSVTFSFTCTYFLIMIK